MGNAWWESAQDPPTNTRSPRLHWAAVLVLSITSHFLFWVIWLIVQAHWVKKVTGRGHALQWSILNLLILPAWLLLLAIPQMIVGYLGMLRRYEGTSSFFEMLSFFPVTAFFSPRSSGSSQHSSCVRNFKRRQSVCV